MERSVYDMMTDTGEIRRNLEVEVKLLIQNEDGNVESVLTKESDVAKKINDIINNRVECPPKVAPVSKLVIN